MASSSDGTGAALPTAAEPRRVVSGWSFGGTPELLELLVAAVGPAAWRLMGPVCRGWWQAVLALPRRLVAEGNSDGGPASTPVCTSCTSSYVHHVHRLYACFAERDCSGWELVLRDHYYTGPDARKLLFPGLLPRGFTSLDAAGGMFTGAA